MPTVGRLPDPYELDVVYADGQPIGRVVQPQIVMDRPDPDHLRPYIEAFLQGDTYILYSDFTDPHEVPGA